ncbi:hypothetical protein OG216_45350 [Streptomycetaceae bacterium NBC_01309]
MPYHARTHDEHPTLMGLAVNPALPHEAAVHVIAHDAARPVAAEHCTRLDAELCARILAYRDHAAVLAPDENPYVQRAAAASPALR